MIRLVLLASSSTVEQLPHRPNPSSLTLLRLCATFICTPQNITIMAPQLRGFVASSAKRNIVVSSVRFCCFLPPLSLSSTLLPIPHSTDVLYWGVPALLFLAVHGPLFLAAYAAARRALFVSLGIYPHCSDPDFFANLLVAIVLQVLGGIGAAWWSFAVYFPQQAKMAAFREFNAKKYGL